MIAINEENRGEVSIGSNCTLSSVLCCKRDKLFIFANQCAKNATYYHLSIKKAKRLKGRAPPPVACRCAKRCQGSPRLRLHFSEAESASLRVIKVYLLRSPPPGWLKGVNNSVFNHSGPLSGGQKGASDAPVHSRFLCGKSQIYHLACTTCDDQSLRIIVIAFRSRFHKRFCLLHLFNQRF